MTRRIKPGTLEEDGGRRTERAATHGSTRHPTTKPTPPLSFNSPKLLSKLQYGRRGC